MELLSESRKAEMEQLSAQILIFVAAVTFQRGDSEQAKEMLQSSATLADGLGDLQTRRSAVELLGSTALIDTLIPVLPISSALP